MFGIFLIILSTVFATSKDLLSKKISFAMHGTLSALLSFVMALPWYGLAFFVAYLMGMDLYAYRGQFLFFIILRASTDAIAELTKMHALSSGDISFVSNFFSLTPIFLLFLAPIITGENIPATGIMGVFIIFVGTALLFKSPSTKIPWKGVILGLISSFFFALNACFDRLAATHGHPIYSGFLMTLFSALILLIPSIKLKAPIAEIKFSIIPLLLRGFFEATHMAFKLAAYQYLEPQYASGISKLALVLSVIVGGSLFKEQDRKLRIISSIIIALGSLIITLTKIFD